MRIEREFSPFNIVIESQEDYLDIERVIEFAISIVGLKQDLTLIEAHKAAKRIKALLRDFEGVM